MTTDPHETAFAVCDRGHTFEDLAVAIESTGGWCTECDAPARGPGERCERCGTLTGERFHDPAVDDDAMLCDVCYLAEKLGRPSDGPNCPPAILPVNAGDDGRWGRATPGREE